MKVSSRADTDRVAVGTFGRPFSSRASNVLRFLCIVALVTSGAFLTLGIVTPQQALMEMVLILALSLFTWRPLVASIALVAFAPVGLILDGGVYILFLALAVGLVTYSLDLWLIVTFGLLTTGLAITGEHLVYQIPQGGAAVATLAGAAAFLIGWSLRSSHSREVKLSTDLTRATADLDKALSEERTRIADELHNIVAHDITLVLMHVRTLPLLQDDQHRRETLATIEDASKQALSDIHRMLRIEGLEQGASQNESGITPISVTLRQIQEHFLSLGIQTELDLSSTTALSSTINTTLVHVARECATNILKHAKLTPEVRIVLTESAGLVILRFWNAAGIEEKHDTSRSSGYGLNRMAERVGLLEGHLRSSSNEGGWLIEAKLPFR
ncbi:hypothetical protein G7068_08520 [Leucobacter viscericola]|uniref:histidine kinase n=1 Tax=Leucobacter viscericola TaxID=2714935 RepID=A0A6G7XFJ0_9MICO|nr:histidine kinase [Leucobacter viscericola]QIK63236.1 hypothetical protein G7068_08520 [Leucobacter viscericola]